MMVPALVRLNVLPGRRCDRRLLRTALMALRRALAPTFRADVMLLFIPSRGGAARRPAHARSAARPARAAWRAPSPIPF
jgi:hypothetical protein